MIKVQIANLHKFTKAEFVQFLKRQSPRLFRRTRLIGGEKTIEHSISVRLTRQQWEKVLSKCADLNIGYGVFIKLLINQYFGLSPNLDDFSSDKNDKEIRE